MSALPSPADDAGRRAALRRAQKKLKDREQLDRRLRAASQKLQDDVAAAEGRLQHLNIAIAEAKLRSPREALELLEEKEALTEQHLELMDEAGRLAAEWEQGRAELQLSAEERQQHRAVLAAKALRAAGDESTSATEAKQRGQQALQRERSVSADTRQRDQRAAAESAKRKLSSRTAILGAQKGEVQLLKESLRDAAQRLEELSSELDTERRPERRLALLNKKMEAVEQLERLQDEYDNTQRLHDAAESPRLDEAETAALRGLQAAKRVRDQKLEHERLRKESEARRASAKERRGQRAGLDPATLRLARDKAEFRKQAMHYFRLEDGGLVAALRDLSAELQSISQQLKGLGRTGNWEERNRLLEEKLEIAVRRQFVEEEREELSRQRENDTRLSELSAHEREVLRSAEALAKERSSAKALFSPRSPLSGSDDPFVVQPFERSGSFDSIPRERTTVDPPPLLLSPTTDRVNPAGRRRSSASEFPAVLSKAVPVAERRPSVARSQVQLATAMVRLRRVSDALSKRNSLNVATAPRPASGSRRQRSSLQLSPSVGQLAVAGLPKRRASLTDAPVGRTDTSTSNEEAPSAVLPHDTVVRWRQCLRKQLEEGAKYTFDLDAEWALAEETRGADARGAEAGRGGGDGQRGITSSPSGHHLNFADEDDEVDALLLTIGGGTYRGTPAVATRAPRLLPPPTRERFGAGGRRRNSLEQRRRRAPLLAVKELRLRIRRLHVHAATADSDEEDDGDEDLLAVSMRRWLPFQHSLLDRIAWQFPDDDSSDDAGPPKGALRGSAPAGRHRAAVNRVRFSSPGTAAGPTVVEG
eukprot:TRINITY_DN32274_c0_g1_i1.p1 TRINITY_DN32274_c0_g1~~TRINITY_DN32274_c0_g1_i1.p1  ORF type:complete len:819 (+),score=352.02 TRINITY_DN32274_c0_g1_i1:51-2507(+)